VWPRATTFISTNSLFIPALMSADAGAGDAKWHVHSLTRLAQHASARLSSNGPGEKAKLILALIYARWSPEKSAPGPPRYYASALETLRLVIHRRDCQHSLRAARLKVSRGWRSHVNDSHGTSDDPRNGALGILTRPYARSRKQRWNNAIKFRAAELFSENDSGYHGRLHA